VHRAILAIALKALRPSLTLTEFQASSGIRGRTAARNVLDYLIRKEIGQQSDYRYSFSKSDRMRLAILALQNGNDLETISRALSWQDFEAFASSLLSLSGYLSECNIYLSKPYRMQIDVVGVNHKSRLAIVADCKHWKKNHLSLMLHHARNQAKRSLELLKCRRNISQAIPIVLTLYPMGLQIVEGVPIVPISKFDSFIQGLPLSLHEIRVLSLNTIF
jgi:hypothetical protein